MHTDTESDDVYVSEALLEFVLFSICTFLHVQISRCCNTCWLAPYGYDY